ncbi:hypothetical protein ACJQWK_06839 [Exserohilum turcicum]|uniref:Uncharacterized protein n=1 Tax=Exserohilum turcicum (strain 28A) TaxID=671987 RepID=R0K9X6_EXST2|nr:uncharacterized protein SETTUDRAFT_20556 [Exserohilum turcica Et28A]EOA85037.1 hypothetical protein SETTUDRAFT_20556 [Exserohilum turcica Et28A]
MGGPFPKKKRNDTEASVSTVSAKRYGQVLGEYEAAVKKLQDTLSKETRSIIQEVVEAKSSKLQEHQIQHTKLVGATTANKVQATDKITPSAISVEDVARIVSNAQTTRGAFVAFEKASTCAQLKLELCNLEEQVSKEEEALVRSGVVGSDWCKCYEKISNLRAKIQVCAYKLQDDREQATHLIASAYKAMRKAAYISSCNIEIPGLGTWTSMPMPATVPDKYASASTQISSESLIAVKPRYQSIQKVSQDVFAVGDIGWLPLPRLSLCPSPADIPSSCGAISLKTYPFIIARKLPDCMIGLVISTAGGDGLTRKPEAIRQRSTYIFSATTTRILDLPSRSSVLNPRVLLKVQEPTAGDGLDGYSPDEGAFVDMLDTYTIQYDSRFEKVACLTKASVGAMKQMRLSALLHGGFEG